MPDHPQNFPPPPVKERRQARVDIEWTDGMKRTFRYAEGVNVNYQLGVIEIFSPKDYPRGQIVVPYMAPNSVRIAIMYEEQIIEAKPTLVVP